MHRGRGNVVRALAALACVGLSISPGPAAASGGEVTLARGYVGGGLAASGQPWFEMQVCLREAGQVLGADAPDLGGGCFTDLLPMAPLTFTHMDVVVDDELSAHVVARYTFRSSSGSILGRALFCDATPNVAVPAGTWRVDVGLFYEVQAGPVCGAGPSTPTTGVVAVALRRVVAAA